jgi:hypothetical protein
LDGVNSFSVTRNHAVAKANGQVSVPGAVATGSGDNSNKDSENCKLQISNWLLAIMRSQFAIFILQFSIFNSIA